MRPEKLTPRIANHGSTSLQVRLQRFFSKLWVELAVGVLVIISVLLTLAEFAFEASLPLGVSHPTLELIAAINDLILIVFMVELTLRYYAARRKIRFFREFWIDIIAVIPLFRIFPFGRGLRLLRLVRVLRLFGLAARLASRFPYVFRQGAIEFLDVSGLLVITVVVGTGAIMFFENAGQTLVANPAAEIAGEDAFDFENSFWFSVYSLFAGEPTPIAPRTVGGKLIAVFIMFMGLTIFAMFTGTVSAFMIQRFRTERTTMEHDDLHDHIIICGWNSKAEIIVREYRASTLTREIPMIVIAELSSEQVVSSGLGDVQVMYLNDDFTRVSALERAGVESARTCIILADTTGGRSEQDADARTILTGLTVEKLNPSVYTCAEVLNRSYAMHLKMGHVDDYVVSGEYSAYMLAQAAMNRGLMGVFTELLTYQQGNEFYRLQLPDDWLGKTFAELMASLKQSHNAILIAVCPEKAEMIVNPREYSFNEGDEIVVIAEQEIAF